MYDYIFTPQADEDLEKIVRYTRDQWGEQQLKRYLTALERGIVALIDGHISYREIGEPPSLLRMVRIEHHYVRVLTSKLSFCSIKPVS